MLIQRPRATAELQQEQPPWSFRVVYWYKEGGKSFEHLAFANTMIKVMAAMTARPWNGSLKSITFKPDFGVRISFVADRTGPGLLYKHVVWALEELFDVMVEHNRYGPGTQFVNSDWEEARIAIGSVSTLGVPNRVPANATVARPGNFVPFHSYRARSRSQMLR